jgi:hypothetical protein
MTGQVDTERIRVLRQIAGDIEHDVARWEGAEFNGRNVSEMFGELAACVAALAKILAAEIETRGEYVG